MESTAVYWKPVFNILEGALNVVLVNAQHCRGLPGRKTDVKDCEWIAELHLHGLVRPSFIPAPQIRELRDLVRTRTTLIADRSRQVNRVLQGAGRCPYQAGERGGGCAGRVGTRHDRTAGRR